MAVAPKPATAGSLPENGIYGWLLVVMFVFTVGIPLMAVLNVVRIVDNDVLAAAYGRYWSIVQVLEVTVGVAIMTIAIDCAFQLWRTRRWASVRSAIRGLIIIPVISVVWFCARMLLLYGWSSSHARSLIIGLALKSTISPAIWCSYLYRSKRVALTYPRAPDPRRLAAIFE